MTTGFIGAAEATGTRRVRIVIVGGGFSGIGMAIRLRQQGIDDFVILERATDVGGTWRDNSYPGCACDVQSTLYSFSFAPNPEWSRVFSPQPEIWAELRQQRQNFVAADSEAKTAGRRVNAKKAIAKGAAAVPNLSAMLEDL